MQKNKSIDEATDHLPIIPGRGLVTKLSSQLRLDFLEANGINVDKIADTQLNLQDIHNNIESYIGSTEIPLGIVGPLLYNSPGKQELIYCAVGTLEGALVASMNRGARALSLSGGFSAQVTWQKMTRSPLFLFETEKDAFAFSEYATTIFAEAKAVAESHSDHAQLIDIEVIHQETAVHLKFIYSTGDASGQNMTTTCTWHAMLFIAEKFKHDTGITPLDFVIEGNGASDKKVSEYNIISGRGINVTAECFLEEKVINKILRTTSEKMIRCFHPSKKLAKTDGMVGYNINVANAIASIFVATGQDLASIHESGIGFLELEKKDDGLLLRLNLPNLVIGTVGGGTHLPKQAQALEIMNCLGDGKVERFASLIAGFALGLEISTYAAIVSGEFAKAHEKLGRNKPVKWLQRSNFTKEFIDSCFNTFFKDKEIQSIYFPEDHLFENGIITNVAVRITKKLIGFIPVNIRYKNKINETVSLNLLIKSKPLDEEVIKGLHIIAASIDPELSDLIYEFKDQLEYKNCHLKESELYDHLHKRQYPYIPAFYGKHMNAEREIFFFMQERFDHSKMNIINSENNPEKWERKDILNTIKAITQFHQQVIPSEFEHIRKFHASQSKTLYKKLISILIKDAEADDHLLPLKNILTQIDSFEKEETSISIKKTIIHNDFNPRNIAVRSNGDPVIYDWELAVVDFPHRDIVELLSFVLPENFKEEELYFYLKYHFGLYANESWVEWLKAYKYSLKTYIACRVSFYEVSGILMKYEFSKRILNTSFRMLAILEKGN